MANSVCLGIVLLLSVAACINGRYVQKTVNGKTVDTSLHDMKTAMSQERSPEDVRTDEREAGREIHAESKDAKRNYTGADEASTDTDRYEYCRYIIKILSMLNFPFFA